MNRRWRWAAVLLAVIAVIYVGMWATLCMDCGPQKLLPWDYIWL